MKITGAVRLVESVACPTCDAEPGWTCRTRGFGGDRSPHAARYRLAGADTVTGEAPNVGDTVDVGAHAPER